MNKNTVSIKPVFLSSINIRYRMTSFDNGNNRCEFPKLNERVNKTGYVLKRKK